MQSMPERDSGTRRQRVYCAICERPVEMARMRDHLRSEHQLDSSSLEKHFLEARIEARRARRSRL